MPGVSGRKRETVLFPLLLPARDILDTNTGIIIIITILVRTGHTQQYLEPGQHTHTHSSCQDDKCVAI